MPKRSRADEEGEEAYLKRAKLTRVAAQVSAPDVRAARDLQVLVAFCQNVNELREG
jgi:hypothetical protein